MVKEQRATSYTGDTPPRPLGDAEPSLVWSSSQPASSKRRRFGLISALGAAVSRLRKKS